MADPSGDRRTVVVEREVSAPPEKIWRALTQPHLIEEWLMKADFAPVPGHHFQLRRNPAPDIEVVIDCTVLAVEPYERLSYSWRAYGLDTVVTFTLIPGAGKTLIRIEQAGFPADQRAAFKGARASWPHFLAGLEDLLTRLP